MRKGDCPGRREALIFLFLTILIFSSGTAQSPVAAGKWEEFRSYQGQFRILTPGPFTEKVDSIDTYVGKLAHHTFFFQPPEDGGDNLFYMVTYYDYPEHSIHSDSTDMLEEFFEVTMESAAGSVRGEILYKDDVRLGRYPGKLWRLNYLDAKAVIKTRAYLVGRRFYSLQTIMYRNKSLNPSSDKFLDSFRLLE